MQDNKIYRPPANSLLSGSSPQKASRPYLRRFVVTLLWAFPLFTFISFYNSPLKEWLVLGIGSFFIGVVSALVAMCLPTPYKSIYVVIGTVAGLGIALISASH